MALRVFITGAGMIGCHTATLLRARSDQVTLFDLAPNEAYIRRFVGDESCDVVRGDICELPGLIEAIQRAEPDVVVHTAGLIAGGANRSPYRGYQVNLGGTLNVAEAVRLLGVRRLLHASSLAVHDVSQPQPGPIPESFPVGGRDGVYPTSKAACELVLKTYATAYGFELAVLRFASVYGYGHFAGGSDFGLALHDLIVSAVQGVPATRTAPLTVPNEFIYVKDLAPGIAACVHAQRLTQRIYNLGTGTLILRDDVQRAAEQAFPGVAVGPIPPAQPGLRSQPMDSSAAARDFGFETHYDLVAGMRDYAAEVRRGF